MLKENFRNQTVTTINVDKFSLHLRGGEEKTTMTTVDNKKKDFKRPVNHGGGCLRTNTIPLLVPELRSCVKVEVNVLDSPSLIVRTVSVDVSNTEHLNYHCYCSYCCCCSSSSYSTVLACESLHHVCTVCMAL